MEHMQTSSVNKVMRGKTRVLITTLLLLQLLQLHPTWSDTRAPTCNTRASVRPCPPFTTAAPPPYPFSTVLGCGHPSFHLRCAVSRSHITINNLTFTLLNYDPTSYTLTLTPIKHNNNETAFCNTRLSSIPFSPLNFSDTPFKMASSSCSRVSYLKPCTSLPKCSRSSSGSGSGCPWECSLVESPFRLVEKVCDKGGGSGSGGRVGEPEQGCQSDVLGYLDNVLKLGVSVEYEPLNDDYFNKCSDCRGVCGYNVSDPNNPFLCILDDESRVSNKDNNNNNNNTKVINGWIREHKSRVKLGSLVLLVMLCLLCLLVVAYIVVQNKRVRAVAGLEDPTTTFLHRHRSAALLPPVFTYEELEASTNRFDPKRKIGDGGFGSVFLGKLFDGRVVAVKYLHRNHHTAVGEVTVSSKSFCNEILILSSIDHPNLVRLHGYCSDPRGLLLVYDYIPNGTLADHLHGPKRKVSGSLGWQTRVDIAMEVAIAIEYLHFTVEPPVVHRDITTSNIFVDERMRVRVGDFGLSRLLVYSEYRNSSGELSGSSSGCIWTGPQGTPGYLDPDYHKSFRLTEKSDVYSFGVVLLELITGLRAVDQRREKREVALVDMVVAKIQLGLLDQVVDPSLATEGVAVEESVAAVAELAFQCVAADKDDRPDAKEVVAELRRIWSRTRGVRGSNAHVVVVPAGAETMT